MSDKELELMTIKEVAKHLGCHQRTVSNMERSGRIKAVRFGSGDRKMVRYKRSEVLKLIEKGGE
jgi:excisionase family DNA binding protein